MNKHLLLIAAIGAGVYLFISHFFGGLSGFTHALGNGTVGSAFNTSSPIGTGAPASVETASIFQGSGSLAPSKAYYSQNQLPTYGSNPAAQPNNVAAHLMLARPGFRLAMPTRYVQ